MDVSLFVSFVFFFFLQAEDGIRDYKVTGVQTCALPIWKNVTSVPPCSRRAAKIRPWWASTNPQIGRASCRERVETSGVAVSLKKKKRNIASVTGSTNTARGFGIRITPQSART